jgi:hypothetical protein
MARQTRSRGNEYTRSNRSVGCGVFYAIRVTSNTQYIVKGKYANNFSKHFLFLAQQLALTDVVNPSSICLRHVLRKIEAVSICRPYNPPPPLSRPAYYSLTIVSSLNALLSIKDFRYSSTSSLSHIIRHNYS